MKFRHCGALPVVAVRRVVVVGGAVGVDVPKRRGRVAGAHPHVDSG